MIKFNLAVLGFFFVFISNGQIKTKDQKIINHLIDKLNKELVVDSFDTPRNISKKELDSILSADYRNGIYKSGTVTYSPDKMFKVFVIEGEACGMNCKPQFEGFIYYNLNRKKPSVLPISMYPIDKISKIGTTYLIFQSAQTGGGNIFYDNKQVTIFTINNGKLIFNKLTDKKTEGIKDHINNGSFEISQPSLFEENPLFYLKYNTKTKSIEYQYNEVDDNYNITKLIKGSFKI